MRRTPVQLVVLFSALLVIACEPGAEPLAAPIAADTAAPLVVAAPSSGPAAAGATEDADETITITFAAAEEERAIFEPLIARFEASNPDVRVQLVDIQQAATTIAMPDGGEMTTIGPESIRKVLSLADTVTGIGPTLEAIAKGWVRDLTPFIDADSTFQRDDFYPHTLAATQDGHIYTLPAKQYIDLLAYNKDLWARRGLPPPKPDWTWRDLKAAAAQLAHKRGDTIEVYGMVDWEFGLPALLAELADASFQHDPAAALRLDDPAIVAALDRVVALARSGAYSGVGDFRQRILDQQVGIWPATPNILADDRGILPHPGFAIGTIPRPGGSSGVSGYLMSGGTQHPNEAWRWLSFLSHQVVAEPYANANPAGMVPARRSVAEQSGYWKRLDAATAAAIQAVLDRQVATLALPDLGLDAEAPIRAALHAAVSGEQTPAAALRQAQAALEQRLAEATPEPTPATDQIAVPRPAPAPPPGATTIAFGAPGGTGPLDQIAQTFNQRTSGVFVQVKHLDLTSGRPASIADLAQQTDCFVGDAPAVDDLPKLLDLQPLLDADPSDKLDDYPAVVLAQFQRDSQLYGLPYGLDLRVLNYNQTAFDAVGLAHPTAEWTLDDFAHAARRLAQGSGNNAHYGFASTFLQWRDVFFFLERFGVSATTGTGADIQPNFTDPQVAQTIRFYLDLLRATSPHTRLGGYQRGSAMEGDIAALVASGRVGMWFDFGTAGSAAEYHGFTRAIAPPPLGQAAPTPNDFRASGLYISAQTQQPQACWTWLKALSDDIGVLQGAFPARISLAVSQAFASQAPLGAAEVFKAYRAAFQRPLSGQLSEPASRSPIDYYWFFRAIDRALQGRNVESELADAQKLTEQFISCVRSGTKGGICATRVDSKYQGWRYAAPASN
jgi:multiple sugar transport system substrate-binding protein